MFDPKPVLFTAGPVVAGNDETPKVNLLLAVAFAISAFIFSRSSRRTISSGVSSAGFDDLPKLNPFEDGAAPEDTASVTTKLGFPNEKPDDFSTGFSTGFDFN